MMRIISRIINKLMETTFVGLERFGLPNPY
jgi:hypothetical protein